MVFLDNTTGSIYKSMRASDDQAGSKETYFLRVIRFARSAQIFMSFCINFALAFMQEVPSADQVLALQVSGPLSHFMFLSPLYHDPGYCLKEWSTGGTMNMVSIACIGL